MQRVPRTGYWLPATGYFFSPRPRLLNLRNLRITPAAVAFRSLIRDIRVIRGQSRFHCCSFIVDVYTRTKALKLVKYRRGSRGSRARERAPRPAGREGRVTILCVYSCVDI